MVHKHVLQKAFLCFYFCLLLFNVERCTLIFPAVICQIFCFYAVHRKVMGTHFCVGVIQTMNRA